jgi:hypothetical protein
MLGGVIIHAALPERMRTKFRRETKSTTERESPSRQSVLCFSRSLLPREKEGLMRSFLIANRQKLYLHATP